MKRLLNKSGLIVLMVAIVASLGVSYAGYTAVLETKADLTTGNMDFQFCDSGELHSIEMQSGQGGSSKELDADFGYDGKNLKISNIEAIDMSLLKKGNLRFIIKYGIKPSDDSSILNAVIKSKNDDCEYVSMMRNNTTTQWIIRGETDDLGYDGKAAGTIPSEIDSLMPDNLGDFQVIESYLIARNKEYLEGTIILEQTDAPDWISSAPIHLSQLNLSEESIEEIIDKDDLTISIYGFYSFEIPLDLNQFNVD